MDYKLHSWSRNDLESGWDYTTSIAFIIKYILKYYVEPQMPRCFGTYTLSVWSSMFHCEISKSLRAFSQTI